METLKKQNHNGSELIDDLLIEILSRLTTKNLLRFRYVSKSWHALICNLYISKRYSPPFMTGLFSTTGNYISTSKGTSNISSTDFNLNFLPSHRNIIVCDSCNGLLLCKGYDHEFENTCLYVCNPATKKWVEVCYYVLRDEKPILEYDPNVSNHFRIFSFIACNTIIIYSSRTNEWIFQSTNPQNSKPCHIPTIFLNGLSHMIYNMRDSCIVVKVEGIDYVRIMFPGNYTRFVVRDSHIGVSNGCLHCAVIVGKRLHVWVLKKYFDKKSWELKHDISLEPIIEKEGVDSPIFWHIVFHFNLDVIFLQTYHKLYSYDLMKGEYDLLSIGCSRECFYLPYCPTYLDFGGSK